MEDRKDKPNIWLTPGQYGYEPGKKKLNIWLTPEQDGYNEMLAALPAEVPDYIINKPLGARISSALGFRIEKDAEEWRIFDLIMRRGRSRAERERIRQKAAFRLLKIELAFIGRKAEGIYKGWLQTKVAAQILGLTDRRVRQLCAKGILRAVMTGTQSTNKRTRRGNKTILVDPASVDHERAKRAKRKVQIAENYKRRSIASRLFLRERRARRIARAMLMPGEDYRQLLEQVRESLDDDDD